jgi:aspartyl-tRNA synthetase
VKCKCFFRQPEFSQLDMEMTFMDQDAIIGLVEQLVAAIFGKVSLRPCP